MDLAELTLETFEPLRGDTFRVRIDDRVLDLELIEVGALPIHAEHKRAPFALVFRAPAGVRLEQATYRVEHDRIGTVEIFMVPIGQVNGALRLEAIFN